MIIQDFIAHLKDAPKIKIMKYTPKRDWNKPFNEQPKPFYMETKRNKRSFNDYRDTVFNLFGNWYYIEPLLGFYKNSSNWRNPIYKNEHEFTEAWLTQMQKKHRSDKYIEIDVTGNYGLLDLETSDTEISVCKLADDRLTISFDNHVTTLVPVKNLVIESD